ncbi:hypothetical protein IF650_16775 [Cellulosimicrobium terreum]|nr:hypothetical protein [Cellulosimicrobium terreum]
MSWWGTVAGPVLVVLLVLGIERFVAGSGMFGELVAIPDPDPERRDVTD